MGIVEILGVAGSLSLLAGWRLYLTILATGIAMHFGWLPLPEHLAALQVLANPWVLGVAAIEHAEIRRQADRRIREPTCRPACGRTSRRPLQPATRPHCRAAPDRKLPLSATVTNVRI